MCKRRNAIQYLEGRVEVLDIDILVRGSLTLAPEQQALLGCHLLYTDVLDSEPQDDGPDHTQGHLQIPINNFCKITFLYRQECTTETYIKQK